MLHRLNAAIKVRSDPGVLMAGRLECFVFSAELSWPHAPKPGTPSASQLAGALHPATQRTWFVATAWRVVATVTTLLERRQLVTNIRYVIGTSVLLRVSVRGVCV